MTKKHSKKRITKNYGLKIDYPKEGDYILGGISPIPKEILQPDKDWTSYLPIKELQNKGFETYACVSFTILNCVEALIFRKYGIKKNYADRFLAAISGTKEGGNSPQVVCEFLRKVGVVPEELWPFAAESFEDFYKPIPPKLYELAREFNNEWIFKHEFVEPDLIDEALTYSPLLISVYAWTQDSDGLYYKPAGVTDNHATTYIKREEKHRLVFDSYDNYLKEVRLDAVPIMIKRFYIEKKNRKLTFWQRLLKILKLFN